MRQKAVFIFLDGIGIDKNIKTNPFSIAKMEHLNSIIGGSLVVENTIIEKSIVFKGIDASLGVEGTPQSATGQTALFTGINAPKVLGYHYPAFPNDPLIKLINKENILKVTVEKGFKSTFANAYTPNYFKMVEDGKRKHSATTLSVIAAGLPFRGIENLKEGSAVYWDITNATLVKRYKLPIKIIKPEEAGINLAKISFDYDLVLFESFLPDLIGHSKDMYGALSFLKMFDQFFYGLMKTINTETTIILTSDHGNLEDISVADHTKNPVMLLVKGFGAGIFANISSISEIKKKTIELLSN